MLKKYLKKVKRSSKLVQQGQAKAVSQMCSLAIISPEICVPKMLKLYTRRQERNAPDKRLLRKTCIHNHKQRTQAGDNRHRTCLL